MRGNSPDNVSAGQTQQLSRTQFAIRIGRPTEKTHGDEFNDDSLYSCFAHHQKNSVYLTKKPVTGKFLNSRPVMKEDFNNKFVPHDNSAQFSVDSVFDETTRCVHPHHC